MPTATRPALIPFDPAALDAVVFDIGGVFTVRHQDPVRQALQGTGFGAPDDPEAYRRAHHAAVRAMSDVVAAGGTAHDYEASSRRLFEAAYLRSLGVAEEVLEDTVEAFVAGLGPLDAAQVWSLVLDENVAGFHRIAATGLPVAVVSNNNGTAENQLRDFGVAQVGPGPLPSLAAVVDSRLVGVAKPDPAIFAPALAALRTDPARTLYVGDTVHSDVLGASAAGMPVVQLDPYDLHAGFEHARTADVGALADLLER